MKNHKTFLEEKNNRKSSATKNPVILSKPFSEESNVEVSEHKLENICIFMDLMGDFIKSYEKNAKAPVVEQKEVLLKKFIRDWLHPRTNLADSHASQHTGSRNNKSQFNVALQKNPLILQGLTMCCIQMASLFYGENKNDNDRLLKSKPWDWIIELPFPIGTERKERNMINEIFLDNTIFRSDHQKVSFHCYPVDGLEYASNANVQFIHWESFKDSLLKMDHATKKRAHS